MSFDPKLSVSAGLDHLAERLDPIITAKFPTDLGGHPWTVVLNQLDQIAGKPPRNYSTTDLQSQLKVLTRRLGNLGFPFDDHKQTLGALGRELTIVRNARAHGDPFSRLDAWRAHDYCVRLLEYFGDAEGLERRNRPVATPSALHRARSPGLRVIPRQHRRGVAVAVTGHDRVQQVPVPVTGRHHPN